MTRFPLIDIRQPQPYDLVDRYLRVAGIINTGDTPGTVHVLDADGNELAASETVAGRMMGGGDFGVTITVPTPPSGTGTVVVRLVGGDEASVEVTFGEALIPGYNGFSVHVVEPGDTLSGIAATYLEDENRWPLIATANRDIVSDPDLIHPGQELRIPLDGALL